MVPLVKSKTLGINIGTTYVDLLRFNMHSAQACPSVVSTPFMYHPRTRPSVPLPPALTWTSSRGLSLTPDWRTFEVTSKTKKSRLQDVLVKLHIPKSRIFCFTQRIPFYLTIESSAVSLAAFLPFAPSSGTMNSRAPMKIEVLRQATVDIK